ncbi:hypothetical protein TYRP_001458 [Tyrophagus putrescentiae]|nr:hypothetical protein TYRP_001458 [Tyrophagus putrescentiae]
MDHMDHGHMGHGHGMDHEHMNHTMHMDMEGMIMYFHFGSVSNILFKGWSAATGGEWTYSIAAIVALGILFEGLKFFREVIQARQADSDTEGDGLLRQLFDKLHLLQTVLHGLQYVISYSLMLIAMTYQVYLCLAIVVGCAIGYFIFTPLSARVRAKYQSFGDPCCG